VTIERPRILFVSCTPIEAAPSTGADQRLRMLYEGFLEIGHVDVHHPAPPVARNGRPLGALRDDSSRTVAMYPWLSRVSANTQAARCFRQLRPADYDIVFLHRLGAAWWTRWTNAENTIVDLDDVPSLLYFDRMRFGTRLLSAPRWLRYRWARINERRILDCFRCSLVCSEEDRHYLRHDRVAVIPNVFWQLADAPAPEYRAGDGGMLFVGSLGYPPNAQGLAWFIREILPRIRARLPGTRLTVIGRSPSSQSNVAWMAAKAAAEAVDWVGTVDDVAPFIDACTLEVCPLLRGLGTRVKILESLAHGKPIVSTTVGAWGLPLGEAEGVFRRDDPVSYAEACVQLLTNSSDGAALGRAGQRFVLTHHSPRSVKKTLQSLVTKILEDRAQSR
jgi:glycosyltransferase involved in cell wall biosynthesis